ncbi:MAG: ECF-type sigma factor, partial [Planctomycetota bacterium]
WRSEQHFLNTVASTMRRVLVDQARSRRSSKRVGSEEERQNTCCSSAFPFPIENVVAIHDALEHYSHVEPTKAKLVELRVFGGSTIEEAADVLGVSKATAKRYWTIAKLQLAELL